MLSASPVQFQSTPPHGGRPRKWSLSRLAAKCRYVSIHAPARGATRRWRVRRITIPSLFQSTPPHGGRPKPTHKPVAFRCFNPRPRTGGDIAIGSWPAGLYCFNPRPRTGGRPSQEVARLSRMYLKFQSTPPHGGATDPAGTVVSADVVIVFQSTPPHGGRLDHKLIGLQSPGPTDVSIHAPARGATALPDLSVPSTACFNPRPRTGGDKQTFFGGVWINVSIHAPARGATCVS